MVKTITIAKTPCKKHLSASELFPPIEFQKNWMYDDSCERFCSVVRISRDHTGDLTEEMSGLKPTFYLLQRTFASASNESKKNLWQSR
jgi:hypothetical protein